MPGAVTGTHAWVLHLDTLTILRLFYTYGRRQLKKITFFACTSTAKWILTLMANRPGMPVIEYLKYGSCPAEPALDLSAVKMEDGEPIIFPITRETVRLQRKFMVVIIESADNTAIFKWARERRYLTEITAFMGLQVCHEIAAPVTIAYYARRREPAAPWRPLLVIPVSHGWAAELREELDSVITVMLSGFEWKKLLWRWIWIAADLADAVAAALRLRKIRPSTEYRPQRLMINYIDGFDRNGRNDIPFYDPDLFDSNDLLVSFIHSNLPPNEKDIEWLKSREIKWFSHFDSRDTAMTPWRPTPLYAAFRIEHYRRWFSTIRDTLRARAHKRVWFIHQTWKIGKRIAYWQDFFAANRAAVNLVVNAASELSFYQGMAIASIGGMQIAFERSIRSGGANYLADIPCHIQFVSGHYSVREAARNAHTRLFLITGYLHSHNDPEGEDEKRRIIGKINDGVMIVTFFDQPVVSHFMGDAVRDAYRAVMDLVMEGLPILLLIKTKRPSILSFSLPDIKKDLDELVSSGHCRLIDPGLKVFTAARHSDLVVSLPSTSAFESILAGTRTIIFNPKHISCEFFYQQECRNTVIFEDAGMLKQAIRNLCLRQYTASPDGIRSNAVGDCRSLINQIDPFCDGQGGIRMGRALSYCMDGLRSGLSREEILLTTADYSRKIKIIPYIGHDAVVSHWPV